MTDTKNLRDMSQMFFNCRTLPSIEVSNFDTQNMIDMSEMFQIVIQQLLLMFLILILKM